MHTGKEPEAHQVEEGRSSCDSYAPHAGSARSDSTSVVKVNRRKTNRRKTRPYCINVILDGGNLSLIHVCYYFICKI